MKVKKSSKNLLLQGVELVMYLWTEDIYQKKYYIFFQNAEKTNVFVTEYGYNIFLLEKIFDCVLMCMFFDAYVLVKQ